ncbi:MAG: DEAD/DEAH box helicase [Rhodocyclaceae bacterium]|jgi:superfamily II DNA or RNA helicase|nr:DEAD/DEAH box helicase [Rhodocyclaceae bacterium]
MTTHLAPGIRVEIRDAEWRIKRVDRSSDGGDLLACEGLSELVRGRDAMFLTKLEASIRVLEPEATDLVDDTSSGYRASLLYLDTLLRQTPPTDDRIHVAHRAAMDLLPFQLDPARQALGQPRQRILIADSVGLGKTLEAGILVSELIARGRGRRILVLAVKSMLSQFQQEFWNRFTIPLTRLDSQGLQRVRNRIPANHNPFHYFDRAIISIDTLKQDIDYRHYLENAYWDIIVIDEAHNVAERGSNSQRSRLARLLATRSDTLIMLSATPHDGKPESFASLVNMLDPTAIANPSDYGAEDFRDKGLVIRRFKHHVRDQLAQSFPERRIEKCHVPASAVEDNAYQALMAASFHTLDGRGAGQLFRTTLEKALFSSPTACASTIRNRLGRLQKLADQPEIRDDIDTLNGLLLAVQAITPDQFSKYQYLCRLLGDESSDFDWDPKRPDDRLVIFTESIQTLDFLHRHLPEACKLKANQVAVLRGDMPDSELAATVDAFNSQGSPLRLLICSDVASEGINLHHLSHRLIHFDIPWSLMVFQQRNGRIDRYGQTRQPQIRYLLTDSSNPRVKGDARILEILIDKDEQAGRNIGDPSEFFGLGSIGDEEARTAEYMERDDRDDISAIFAAFLDDTADSSEDGLANFIPDYTPASSLEQAIAKRPALFDTDLDYARAALRWLDEQGLDMQSEVDGDTVRLTAPSDLRQRLRYLPAEVRPDNDRFILCADKQRIYDELRRCREEDSPWPAIHYLWRGHPVMEWLGDRALNAFGRHTAPVIRLPRYLVDDEHWVLTHGGFPNRRGQVHIQDWCAVRIRGGQVAESTDFATLRQRLPLDELVNPGRPGDTGELQQLLPIAVNHARGHLRHLRKQTEAQVNDRLNQQLEALEQLRARHLGQMELDLGNLLQSVRDRRREDRAAQINRVFDDYLHWLENTQITEETPYLQVVALFTGQPAAGVAVKELN